MNQPHHKHRNPSGNSERDRHAWFLRLYTKYQHRILAYIFTLVPNWADAEDLLQETAVLLWEKFDEFEPETDFVAWACRVAFLQVCNYRRQKAKTTLLLDDELLAKIAARSVELAPELEERRKALNECLHHLDERDRRMIFARYEPNGSVQSAAAASGRSLQAAYKALYRIRKALFDCVSLRVGEKVIQ